MFGLLSYLPLVHKFSECRHYSAVCFLVTWVMITTQGMSTLRWYDFSASHHEVTGSVCFNDLHCLIFYYVQLVFFIVVDWSSRGKMNSKDFRFLRSATACQSPCQNYPLCISYSSAWSKFNWLKMRSIIRALSLQPRFIRFTSWNEQSLGLFLT